MPIDEISSLHDMQSIGNVRGRLLMLTTTIVALLRSNVNEAEQADALEFCVECSYNII